MVIGLFARRRVRRGAAVRRRAGRRSSRSARLAGLSASIYDPAARGYLVDANPPERQGETFGLYGAAQMGGLMLGPAIGGIAAAAHAATRRSPFWVAGHLRVRCRACSSGPGARTCRGRTATPRWPPRRRPRRARTGDEQPAATSRPTRLLNRLLIAAIVINVGSFFASGAYEVVWSLYLDVARGGPRA